MKDNKIDKIKALLQTKILRKRRRLQGQEKLFDKIRLVNNKEITIKIVNSNYSIKHYITLDKWYFENFIQQEMNRSENNIALLSENHAMLCEFNDGEEEINHEQ